MPNTPITVGSGICLYTPGQSPSNACNMLEALLKGTALLENVPESYMDSLGALTACGPAYVSYLLCEIYLYFIKILQPFKYFFRDIFKAMYKFYLQYHVLR